MGRNINKQTLSVGFGFDCVGHRLKTHAHNHACSVTFTHTYIRHAITCRPTPLNVSGDRLTEAEICMNMRDLCIYIVLFVKLVNWPT